MGLDERLVEILICPACGADVEEKERRKLIICTGCSLQYPIRDGIPVMLVDEANKSNRSASK